MQGTITLGLSADPDERTLELFMTPEKLSAWARPGVGAHLEIVAEGMVFATIINVIVFVPLLFLQGLEGRFSARSESPTSSPSPRRWSSH